MDKGRIGLIVFGALIGGCIGYAFAGFNGSFGVALISAFLTFYITSKDFQKGEKIKRQERVEARDFRRIAYNSEIGRQQAMSDYAKEEKSKKQIKKYIQKMRKRAGY